MRLTLSSSALCALVLCAAARAEDGGMPADAPLAFELALPIHKGEIAPADGVFMTTQKAVDVSVNCRQAMLERTELRAEVEELASESYSSVWPWVGGFLLGMIATGVVVYAAKK